MILEFISYPAVSVGAQGGLTTVYWSAVPWLIQPGVAVYRGRYYFHPFLASFSRIYNASLDQG